MRSITLLIGCLLALAANSVHAQSYLDVLSERQGWGGNTTGGAAGALYFVTTLADSGPGSLREALERTEPLWIRFSVSGAIVVKKSINVKSHKTVDGRGTMITIKTPDHQGTPLRIDGASNIILLNLEFNDEWPNWKIDDEGSDGINISNAQNIWIHHCTFKQWRDGAIDMKGNVSYISITWSRFEKTYQALNWDTDKISFGYNYCADIAARCVQVINGKGHMYNNFITRWTKNSIINAKDSAQIFVQNNIFLPAAFKIVNSRVNGGKIGMFNNYALKPTTFSGNDKLDSAFMTQSQSLAKLTKCAASDKTCWNNLKATIETYAGR